MKRPPHVLVWVRRAFRLLESFAPGIGARWAWKLWTTPPKPRARAVELSRAGGMGEVRMLRIKLPDWTGETPTGPDGTPKPPLTTDIAVELLGPADGPLVYLLHGWGGWRGQFAPIGRALAARGFRAVLIDAPNHGDSGPGTFGPGTGVLPDFTLTLEAVVRELGPAHAVVGHSLGGGCTALAILEGLEPRRAVFIAPAVDPEAFTRELAEMFGYGERIRTRMLETALRRSGHAVSEFVLPVGLAARGDLPPALVVHDLKDPMVHVNGARTMATAWRGAEIVLTTGLGHNKILRHDAVVETVAGFVAGTTIPPATPEMPPTTTPKMLTEMPRVGPPASGRG
jgi:pimeloyl-ACP methyl ester carboxylesterase